MAIAFTSITPLSQNANGKVKEVVASIVVTGTYSAGGTVLTTAQKAQLGADGKVIWQDSDGQNPFIMKYNTTTGALQLFVAPTAAAATAELGAVSGAGTYTLRLGIVGTQASAPAMS